MRHPLSLLQRGVEFILLRTASYLVPVALRSEWLQEWSHELFYIHAGINSQNEPATGSYLRRLSFCFGSFQDAICVKNLNPEFSTFGALPNSTPRQCVGFFTAAILFFLLLAKLLPGVQSEIDAMRDPQHPGVVLINTPFRSSHAQSSISIASYRDWSSQHQEYFNDLAFYRTASASAEIKAGTIRQWTIAQASANLFDLLGIHPDVEDSGTAERAQLPRAFLSISTWRRAFASNPAIVGKNIIIASRQFRVAGVVPDGAWNLPRRPDVWILESEKELAAEDQTTSGILVARLSVVGRRQMFGQTASVPVFNRNGYVTELCGVAFILPSGGILPVFIFSLFLAVLALPAVTVIFRNESGFARRPISGLCVLKGNLFLISKFALVGALSLLVSIDLAYGAARGYSSTAEMFQLILSFTISLLGMRWALIDQELRCPVCLRTVTHPAHVGVASCNFLDWNGTEMICAGGHALLHVPDMPTSWFSASRWVYLDSTWAGLFASATDGPPSR